MLTRRFAVRRSRGIWNDPVRHYRTLVSFSETELDGGKDLKLAAQRVSDPELRMHLERHARDEERHASLFRVRASEVKAEAARGSLDAHESDRAWDLGRARAGRDVDAHGFLQVGLIGEMGDVAYVAMLHVAERRAAELFTVHHAGSATAPATQRVFDEILKDEKYHVAYTSKFLQKWRDQGRTKEVEDALSAARGSRLVGAWRRLGVRSASGFSRVVLFVLYWTLLLPFGALAGRNRSTHGWQPAKAPAADVVSSRGQY